MNIYDPYPDFVEYRGKRYALDLAYDTVLRAMDLQADRELPALSRLELMLYLLLVKPRQIPKSPADQQGLFSAIMDLFPKAENKGKSERYIDFHQDARLIRSAFFRMGIDLAKDRIHFFRFVELLGDLPPDTALARVIDIRQRPIPNMTKNNQKQVAALIEAKSKVAIRMSAEDSEAAFMSALKKSSFMRG